MRSEYTCIGGYLDLDGLSLVRFNLRDTQFKILKSYTVSQKVNYDNVLKQLLTLASTPSEVEIKTIDILANFDVPLKQTILNKNNSEHVLRVKTTEPLERIETNIFNLLGLLEQNRLSAQEHQTEVIIALSQLKAIDMRQVKDIYEKNQTLSHVFMAMCHSISLIEAKMIKLKMV